MNIDPHVRELLRFEEQRLGTAITPMTADASPASCDTVELRMPSPAGSSRVVTVTLGERRWPVRAAELAIGQPFVLETEAGPDAFASLDGSVLRLAIDPSELARHGERDFLNHFWERAIAPALDDAAQHLRATRRDAQLAEFLRLEERWHREALARVPSQLQDAEYQIGRHESQMRELITRTRDLRRIERALQGTTAQALAAAAREQFEAVRRLVPEVYQRIELRGSELIARTYEVTVETDDASIDVGEFDVCIDVASETVSLTNRTRQVDGAHHPHVRSPGDPCWGSLAPGVTRLLAEREWSGLLTVAHRFLHSYNDRDAYLKIEHWSPDFPESDDDDYDDEDSEDETVECSLCLEHVASDEITHVRDVPVCMGCYERDTFVCAACSARFTSRDQAGASIHCRSCWERAQFTCASCQEVKPAGDRAESGACVGCATSATTALPQEVTA